MHDMMKTARIIWSCFIASMIVLNTMFIIDLTLRYTSTQDVKTLIKEPHEGPVKFLTIKVLSSRESVVVAVDGTTVYAKNGKRGLHVVVLNQKTGKVMASKVFDTYVPKGDNAIPTFLHSLTNDRIVCFAILDEATFSLTSTGREPIGLMGSKLISTLKWRDTWAYITVKGKKNISGEDVGRSVAVSDWGSPVNLHVHVAVPNDEDDVGCYWEPNDVNNRRKEFCSKYEGYEELCNCGNPYHLPTHLPLPNNRIVDVPTIIIASNRPVYLYRTLKTLLTTPGANNSLTMVFVDGLFQEPIDVAKMLGVKAINHEPLSQKNGRISQHYKASLTKTFDLFPKAKYVIILEEDLEVAPDFFSYFSQTIDLLDKDSSIYCISAWNDQGYTHSCNDPSLLYRIETMPGLGWLLSRNLYKNELESQWPHPDKLWDWDMWMRTEFIRKGRECIIPDVSRTYHFGESGLNINPYFQNAYFKKHIVNNVKEVTLKNVDRMTKANYEEDLANIIRTATVLDHSKNPCARNYGFIPDTKDKTYVMYISMEKQNDYETWMQLAKCYHLWDLDARGFHKGLWRFWLKQNQIIVIGVPYSPYKSFKPDNVQLIKLKKPERAK